MKDQARQCEIVFGVELSGHFAPTAHPSPMWPLALTCDEVRRVSSKVELRGCTRQVFEDIRQGPLLWPDLDKFRETLFVNHLVDGESAFTYQPDERRIHQRPLTPAAERANPLFGLVEYVLDVCAEHRRQDMLADLLKNLTFEAGVAPGRLTCELKQCLMPLDDYAFDEALDEIRRVRGPGGGERAMADAVELRAVLRQKFPGRPAVLVRDQRDWESRRSGLFSAFASTPLPEPDDSLEE